MPKSNVLIWPSYQFCGLLVALTTLFLMGGSARSDVQSLAALNPVTLLCCGAALLTFQKKHWQERKWLFVGIAFVFLLILSYLLPLSAKFENFSKGAIELASIRIMADVPSASQSLAVVPIYSWQSLFFLFGPLSVLLFAVQLNRGELEHTLLIVILVGAISGIIGVLQLTGNANGPLYLYRITNNGSAVGLFANRNHAAVFLACVFPVLAVFAARSQPTNQGARNTRQLIALSGAIILVPLILVTGSRSGLVAALVGLIGGMFIYTSHVSAVTRLEKDKFFIPILAVSILICLVFASIYFSRAEAIERIFAESSMAQDRVDFWTSSLHLFWKYFPVGFGPGAFVSAFQNDEPLALLNGAYLNRLHNDWLETGVTFGVTGILLMLGSVGYFVRRSFLLWFRMDGRRSTVVLGRMAGIIFAILGIASMSDYPLRTPAMMGFAVLVLLWFAEARREPKVGANNRG